MRSKPDTTQFYDGTFFRNKETSQVGLGLVWYRAAFGEQGMTVQRVESKDDLTALRDRLAYIMVLDAMEDSGSRMDGRGETLKKITEDETGDYQYIVLDAAALPDKSEWSAPILRHNGLPQSQKLKLSELQQTHVKAVFNGFGSLRQGVAAGVITAEDAQTRMTLHELNEARGGVEYGYKKEFDCVGLERDWVVSKVLAQLDALTTRFGEEVAALTAGSTIPCLRHDKVSRQNSFQGLIT